MANKLVKELTASEWVFLTLGAGLTIQKNEAVIFKSDLADRTIKELGSKVSVTDTFAFDFLDADVTVNPANTIDEAAHGMIAGDPVRLSTTGVLPAGLSLGIDYYVVNPNAGDFQLSLTSGGAAVVITAAAGGGTHTVSKMRAKLAFSNFELV